jgi:hypothetical protein
MSLTRQWVGQDFISNDALRIASDPPSRLLLKAFAIALSPKATRAEQRL